MQPGSRAATALALQRTMGNRAVSRLARDRATTGGRGLLMRKPAAEFLEELPEIAASKRRWNEDLSEDVAELLERYGDLDIADYRIDHDNGLLAWLGWKPSIVVSPGGGELLDRLNDQRLIARRLPAATGDDRDTRLLQYLLGLRDTRPPGWGNFGSMTFARDGELEGRPAFAAKTLAWLGTVPPGRARRHVTAWHNLRRLLNMIIRHRRTDLLADFLLHADRDLRAEGERLLAHASDSATGASRANRNVLLAAFIMNNHRDNLWVGGRRENSEIAVYGAAVRRYLGRYQEGTFTHQQLLDAVGDYRTRSPKAQEVQRKLETAVWAGRAQRPSTLARTVLEILEDLEVDVPEDAAHAARQQAASEIHHELYQILYLTDERDVDEDSLRRIVGFFLVGNAPPPRPASWWTLM